MKEEKNVVSAEEVVDAGRARLQDAIHIDGRIVQAVHEATQDDAIAQVAHQVSDLTVLQQGRVTRLEKFLPMKKWSSN